MEPNEGKNLTQNTQNGGVNDEMRRTPSGQTRRWRHAAGSAWGDTEKFVRRVNELSRNRASAELDTEFAASVQRDDDLLVTGLPLSREEEAEMLQDLHYSTSAEDEVSVSQVAEKDEDDVIQRSGSTAASTVTSPVSRVRPLESWA